MSIRFDQPAWLLVLIAFVPMAIVAWRWFGAMSGARRWSAIVLRCVLLGLLGAMLAGATMVRLTDRLAVIAVLDVSGSVERFFDAGKDVEGRPLNVQEAVRGFLAGAARSRKPDDLSGVVVFDSSARAAQPASTRTSFDVPAEFGAAEGTDIESGLRLAGAMVPPGAVGRIVLFSDGAATAGDAAKAAAAFSAGTRDGERSRGSAGLAVVPLNYSISDEVFVESIDVPATAPADSNIPVRIILFAAGEASGTLQLLHDGAVVDINPDKDANGLRLTLKPGRNVQQVTVPLGAGRVHRFEAVWEPDARAGRVEASGGALQDRILTNNRAAAFTVAPGRGSVLVVDGVSGGNANGPGAMLGNTLRAAGIDVETIASDAVQSDLLWMQAFDLVILQNVAADALSREAQSVLVDYVTQLGGGLVMVGGRDSFGAGGWKGSELEPILPVLLDLPERLVTPAAAVIIIIDNSGSMNRGVMGTDRSQQEVANEGAAIAVESMDKTDLVGVISFNSQHRVEVPLGPNKDPKATAERVRSISADGGTFLPPALNEAYRQLRNQKADVKHVIVLSDGVSQGKEELPALAARMAADGISVSTIAVGDGADTQIMSQMAEKGKGQFYRVIDANLLPRIFLKAVKVMRTPMIRETPFTPVVVPSGSAITEGLPVSTMPTLGGLTLTQRRDNPTVVTAMITSTGEPVLAHWNAGLGRVAAFTSDAHEWAGNWLRWPGYAQMWTQLARTIARPPTDRAQQLTAEIVDDRLLLRLDATRDDGSPQDLLSVPGSVYGPDGRKADVRLSQVGPGQYESSVPARASGTYVVTLTPRAGSKMLAPVVGGVSRPTGQEYRRMASDPDALRRIAEAGRAGGGAADKTGTPWGGVFDLSKPRDVDLFNRAGVTPVEARRPLWRWLAIWSIVALLLDIATRRIAWDRFVSREFGAEIKREAAAAVRERGRQAARTVDRLRKRDEEFAADAAATDGPGALGEDDATRIVREQAARRRKAREIKSTQSTDQTERISVDSEDGGISGGDGGTDSPSRTESKENAPESGLMAAKRRAREQMRGENDDGT